MKLKKYCFKFIETSLVVLLPSTAIANNLPGSVSESYISLGLEHTQSDNINQSSDNAESGFEQRADVVLVILIKLRLTLQHWITLFIMPLIVRMNGKMKAIYQAV